eukprot:TRINITY_DN26650_c0_g1_i2.p4 TRINITY_DN26650_c0_g1~~TRINITY_DN26650_c0_g1_i2.p4  ORF type:complete len:108 (+),score=15.68 TRINITY_DN26650_c0_g1_i2:196-519(+)
MCIRDRYQRRVHGRILESGNQTTNNILSDREKEILQLIDQGKMSKEIAPDLSISINTVNRHRQNILEKLHVGNSIEACRIAKVLNLFQRSILLFIMYKGSKSIQYMV